MLWFIISWLIVAFIAAIVFGHAARRDEEAVERDIPAEAHAADHGRPAMR